MLDRAGHETNNRQGYGWELLPGNIGRAVTDGAGRFRIEGIGDRESYWIQVHHPETDNVSMAFYAATIDGPDTVHEMLQGAAFNGRGRHDVKTNPLTVVFPKIRPIEVTVVADDTGRPVAGAGVYTLGESLSTGITSGGQTDDAGKVRIGLPPGEYRGIGSDPPVATRYIRTNQRPFVVKAGDAQTYEIHQTAGAEIIFEAVDETTGKPIAEVLFWKAHESRPGETEQIKPSTFKGIEPWTDATGKLRVYRLSRASVTASDSLASVCRTNRGASIR